MKRRISTILLSAGTIVLILGMLLSSVSLAAVPAAPATVDGLLDADYSWLTGGTLGDLWYSVDENNHYFAIEVDSANVNDNAFDEKHTPPPGDYLTQFGWNTNHEFTKLLNSDHAQVWFFCDEQLLYDFKIDYLYQDGSGWHSGPSGPDGDATNMPPGGSYASSLEWNLQNSGWDYTMGGLGQDDWKSPDPAQGYPDNGLDYSPQWEWRMIYELSVPKTAFADCTEVAVGVVNSHNSPSKGEEDNPIVPTPIPFPSPTPTPETPTPTPETPTPETPTPTPVTPTPTPETPTPTPETPTPTPETPTPTPVTPTPTPETPTPTPETPTPTPETPTPTPETPTPTPVTPTPTPETPTPTPETPTPTPETPTPTPVTPTPTPETPTPTPETPTPETPTPTPETPTPETPTPTPETPTPTPETPTPTPPHCPNATITVHVTECGAPVAGASVEVHSSYGDKYGPHVTNAAGEAVFSVIGGSYRLWYAIVNGARMGRTIEVTECGGTGRIEVVLPCVPTPTPVVEVLGVERLPVTGQVAPSSPFGASWLTAMGLLFIASGGILRWLEKRE